MGGSGPTLGRRRDGIQRLVPRLGRMVPTSANRNPRLALALALAVLWISSLSLEYFSLIAIAYYWNTYPENAVTSLLSILFLLLIIWGYYKHRTTQHPSPTLV